MNDQKNPLLGDGAAIANRQALNGWGREKCCCELEAVRDFHERHARRARRLRFLLIGLWSFALVAILWLGFSA